MDLMKLIAVCLDDLLFIYYVTKIFVFTEDPVGNEYWDHLFRKTPGAEIDTTECCM